MELDATLLGDAVVARDRVIRLQHEAELAQVGYQHAIRRLHASGASLRTIADELGVSYQRVHQIVDVSTGKGAVKASKKQGACSFCAAPSDDVRRLIAGPGVSICDVCVDLAAEVLDDRTEKANARTRMVAVRAEQANARCSFCGQPRDRVEGQAEAPDRPPAGKFGRRSGPVRICDNCVNLCGEILSEDRAG